VQNGPVKPRVGTVIAFGLGYALGAKAGRDRYLQIVRAVTHVGRSAPVSGTAALVGTKSRAVANLGVERLKDTIGVRLGWRNGDQAADAIAVDLAEDLASALNHRRDRPEPPARPTRYHRRQVATLGRASGQASSR
jgi:hypothetical protein